MSYKVSLEILVIFILILLNGVFSMAETALVSSKKARLSGLASYGNRRAAAVLALLERPDDFLAAVQIGITLISIFTGIFGGATVAEHMAIYLERAGILGEPFNHAVSIAVMVAVITYFSIIFGELVPKRVALSNPERTAMALVPVVAAITAFAGPAVRLLGASSAAIGKFFGSGEKNRPSVTEEDIRFAIEQGATEGILDEGEKEIIKKAMELSDRGISLFMTHRKDITFLDIRDGEAANRAKIAESPYDLFPVCDGGIDRITGIADTKNILTRILSGDPGAKVTDGMYSPIYIPESSTVLKALEKFRESSVNVGVVMDEFGSTLGMVTRDDVFGAVFGELAISDFEEEEQVIERTDGSLLIDALYPAADLRSLLGVERLPEDEKRRYNTLSGFVLMMMGRIPRAGEGFEWEGIRFEVVDMDGRRIDKVLVTDRRPKS